MYIDENITISDYLSTPYQCPDRYLKTVPPDDTFVLIIGEAARRGSLSAYGYSRKTTPRLDACLQKHPSNVLLYTDAITTAAFTKASVMSIYSPLTVPEELTALHSRPGLSKIFRGSGFQTLYVTTRPKYDLRNMLSTFLDDAETRAYLTTHLKRAYDEEVIPVVMDFLASHPGKRMIVLQLMGSHIEYGAQYPKTHRWFHSGDRLRDTYDDSIRYADYAIHELMDRLLARPEPVCALYVSDHGENLNDLGDGNRGHGTRTLTPYELKTPFVLYFNDAFLKKHGDAVARLRERKDQPVCHDHIAHTFMGLAGIGDPFVYRPSWDLSSPDFRVNPRIVTDENMRPADYTALDFSGKKKIEQFGEMMAEKYRSKFTW
jgi:glucan phosphoethanolaminetransferase (alkaline phosphatase superfamily)